MTEMEYRIATDGERFMVQMRQVGLGCLFSPWSNAFFSVFDDLELAERAKEQLEERDKKKREQVGKKWRPVK